MRKIKIISDSACDITREAEREYNIKIIPFSVVLGDKIYTSRVDFDNAGFFKLMRENDEIPKTSQITAFQFEEVFEECVKEGYTDLILVTINSHGSATYQNAIMAADNFFEDHPEYDGKVSITVHDSGCYTGAYGHPLIQAAKMVREGAEAKEVNAYLADILPRRCVYFGMYTLKYAGKSGRIPSAAAFVGDKLGIKPIMKLWDHEIVTASKCRGDKKMMAKIIDMAVAEMEPGSEYQIVYASNEDSIEELTRRLTEKIGYGPSDGYQVGAEVASNAGPELVGVIFNAKKG